MADEANAWDEADKQFARLRDDKTAKLAKKLDAARVKADTDKSARLKAARLARDAEAASGPKPSSKDGSSLP